MNTRMLLMISTVLCSSWALWAQTVALPKVIRGASSRTAVVEELALANRILAAEGVVDAYGHVSVRSDVDPNHFYLARRVAAGIVKPEDILEYDLDPRQIGTGQAEYSERFIHSEIYKARPDVMAIVHCHSPELIPFGITAAPLLPVFHMAAFLGEGVPVFEIRHTGGATDMLIRNTELGHALAETLGDKPAALMRGHGAVVVGPSLHVVVGRAYYMNMNARLQQQAAVLGGGKVTYMETEEAKKAAPQDGFERAWELWAAKATVK